MSVHKVEMFTVICDNCQKDIGAEQEYSCWNDEQSAKENAMEADWIEKDGSHYCDECYEMNDNDEYIIKTEMKDKYVPESLK